MLLLAENDEMFNHMPTECNNFATLYKYILIIVSYNFQNNPSSFFNIYAKLRRKVVIKSTKMSQAISNTIIKTKATINTRK